MAPQYSLGLPMSPTSTQTSIEATAQDVEWAIQMDMFYADLAQSEEQFVSTLAEQTREYDLSLEEQMREYDETLEEMERQFDLSYGLDEEKFEQDKYAWEEEFTAAQDQWQAEYDASQEQWTAYYENQKLEQEQEAAEWAEEKETSDLNQLLMQQAVDAGEKEAESSYFTAATPAAEEEKATTTPSTGTEGGSDEGTSAASLWDTLAGWSAQSGAESLISQQQEQITDLLYPKSYGPSADYLDIDKSYYGY